MLADRTRVAITIAIAGTIGASLFAAKTLASAEWPPDAPTLTLPAASEPLDVNVTFQQRRHTGVVMDGRVIAQTQAAFAKHRRGTRAYTCFLPPPRAYLQREIDFDVELEELRARALGELGR